MKNLVCLLAILALAAPALADPCNIIDITAEDAGSGQLRISYEVDPCSNDELVGIALLFECSDSATMDPCDPCTIVSTDPCLPVYMDYAHDQIPEGWDPCDFDPCNPPYDIGDGNPIADPCGPGLLGAEGSNFVLCMARVIDPCVSIPKGVVRELAVVQLKDGGAGYTDVLISAEVNLRGGAVGSTFETVNVPAPPGTRVTFAVPTCWDLTECGGQPQGDFTCDGDVNLADLGAIRNAWGTDKDVDPRGTGPGEYNCCADSNHDGLVNLTDLGDIRTGWGTTGHTPATGEQDCPPGYN
jgi:hypothetical protein